MEHTHHSDLVAWHGVASSHVLSLSQALHIWLQHCDAIVKNDDQRTELNRIEEREGGKNWIGPKQLECTEFIEKREVSAALFLWMDDSSESNWHVSVPSLFSLLVRTACLPIAHLCVRACICQSAQHITSTAIPISLSSYLISSMSSHLTLCSGEMVGAAHRLQQDASLCICNSIRVMQYLWL